MFVGAMESFRITPAGCCRYFAMCGSTGNSFDNPKIIRTPSRGCFEDRVKLVKGSKKKNNIWFFRKWNIGTLFFLIELVQISPFSPSSKIHGILFILGVDSLDFLKQLRLPLINVIHREREWPEWPVLFGWSTAMTYSLLKLQIPFEKEIRHPWEAMCS